MHQFIILTLLLLAGSHEIKSQDIDPIIIGTKHTLHSAALNEDREFWISLPDSYRKDGYSYQRYPILIVLDAEAYFRSISSTVHYLSSQYNRNAKIPEMIVVGIKNVDRRRDFTPDKIYTKRANNTGGGDIFLQFLEKELIPVIDQNYRTTSYRILFGHSLGGLLASHAYLKEETIFNAFLAIDPSFGTWDAEEMDKKLDTITSKSFERFIYIATANWDKRNIRNRDRHVRLYESLNSRCKEIFPGKLEYFEKENHSSVPLIAFYNGISSIFEGYEISSQNIKNKDQLIQQYHDLSKRLHWDFKPSEYGVNQIAYRMLQSNKDRQKSMALTFFTLNTENYPNSYNAFDSLGEAYEILGDCEKAIANYKKSLQLYPGNSHAKRKIESLNKNKGM